ncbi:MAG: hypothetical protein EOM05_10640 [Clostridia bacterium]|nr:hypothetical protein [Clostridia bacterium]
MPKKTKKPLLGWCSADLGGSEKRFIQLGVSFFEHPAVLGLTPSELKLYLYAIKEAGQNREFELPRAISKKFMSPPTFHDAMEGLNKKGFIETIVKGKTTRENNRYRFVFGWKQPL